MKPVKNIELTSRELEVLHLIFWGYKAGEIAETLFLSSHTINSHRRELYRKIGARHNRDAMRWYMEYRMGVDLGKYHNFPDGRPIRA